MLIGWRFRSILTFFGLTQEYKLEIHKGIFNMVSFGKGNWTWTELYTMPIFLRNFYLKMMVDAVEKEKNAGVSHINEKVLRPNIKG
jgi:hypothetical protein